MSTSVGLANGLVQGRPSKCCGHEKLPEHENNNKLNKPWRVKSSTVANNTHNPIRKIVDGMHLTPNPDKKMIALSIGDPTVFGNLPPADEVENAVISMVKDGRHNGYAPSVGYETSREAVAKYFSVQGDSLTAKDVILTSGCSGALDICITALANPGENVLIPRPGFSLYKTLCDSMGIKVKHYNCVPEHGWEIDLKHLNSLVDDKTRCIIVCNPSNPCGSVFSKEHIKDICELAARHRLPIIADEVYAYMTFPGHQFHSISSQTNEVPVLSCGGLTKRFIVPGYRLGWILIHDRNGVFDAEVRQGLINLSMRILGPNTLVQGALPKILDHVPHQYFDNIIEHIQKNADLCYHRLYDIPGLNPVMPCGAMYMMVGIDIHHFPGIQDDLDFVKMLVTEQSVFCLPGKCFQYPNFFRVVQTVPTEQMKEACDRIEQFCNKHFKKCDDPSEVCDEVHWYEDHCGHDAH